MKIIILAGGLGTRLKSVIKDLPKPMAPVDGRPFLEHVMASLAAQGATEFILCVSHMAEKITTYFGDNWNGLAVRYSHEETPLGTGGAIRQAFEQFQIDEALIINGDTFLEMDYAGFHEKFAREPLALALKEVDDVSRYGGVEVSNNRVIAFGEKRQTCKSGLINAGVYKLDSSLLSFMPQGVFSFEKEFLEKRIQELRPAYSTVNGFFIDIGIPESYAEACGLMPTLSAASDCRGMARGNGSRV